MDFVSLLKDSISSLFQVPKRQREADPAGTDAVSSKRAKASGKRVVGSVKGHEMPKTFEWLNGAEQGAAGPSAVVTTSAAGAAVAHPLAGHAAAPGLSGATPQPVRVAGAFALAERGEAPSAPHGVPATTPFSMKLQVREGHKTAAGFAEETLYAALKPH